MAMDIEDRVAQAMRQLESNIEKARRNPEAVLQGSFSGTARNVTVWVDSLGRTERCRITPGSVLEGDEAQLIQAFQEATRKARRKAENLEFEDEAEDHCERGAARRGFLDEADADEGPPTWLR
ncbi:YbaB/EbfC family nucleoid-associated protein [Saccharopolyspora phatthalungensis]|uniref:DNA-binding protein YbaB n=1 Tax=Saccharopolyspora phatthalungensis TaxID=664693 RepID=A0A840QJC6_9PSEU|nr:YbaB/EbfC family nucleoid-associated protein [Saccharopolyspora phatthalungensis]MBB5159069.1 DNA-binding protein YbaB [Saccharopolyspora phatthalungensis]